MRRLWGRRTFQEARRACAHAESVLDAIAWVRDSDPLHHSTHHRRAKPLTADAVALGIARQTHWANGMGYAAQVPEIAKGAPLCSSARGGGAAVAAWNRGLSHPLPRRRRRRRRTLRRCRRRATRAAPVRRGGTGCGFRRTIPMRLVPFRAAKGVSSDARSRCAFSHPMPRKRVLRRRGVAVRVRTKR
eukprot:gene17116-biopygen8060